MSQVTKTYTGSKEFLLVYCELIAAAGNRATVSYQQIAKIMGLPMSGNHMARETGQMLGEISRAEVKQNRPMLSAVAVNTEGVPGGGFYALAQELRKLHEDSPAARRQFWEKERDAVYATWERPAR